MVQRIQCVGPSLACDSNAHLLLLPFLGFLLLLLLRFSFFHSSHNNMCPFQLEPRLDILAGPHATLRAALPQVSTLEAVPPDSAAEERLKTLSGKVTLMRTLRRQMLSRLREEARQADASHKLGTAKDATETLQQAMQPLEQIGVKLEENFASQAKVLAALADAYAALSASREQALDLRERQLAFLEELQQAHTTFALLQKKASKAGDLRSAASSRLTRVEEQMAAAATAAAAGSSASGRADGAASGASSAPHTTNVPPTGNNRGPAVNSNRGSATATATGTHRKAASAVPGGEEHRGQRPASLRHVSVNDPRDDHHLDAVFSEADEQLRGAETGAVLSPMSYEGTSATTPSAGSPLTLSVAAGAQNAALDLAIEELRAHIARIEQTHRDGQTGFEKEFALLRMEDLSSNRPEMCSVALRNATKNRWGRALEGIDGIRTRLLSLSLSLTTLTLYLPPSLSPHPLFSAPLSLSLSSLTSHHFPLITCLSLVSHLSLTTCLSSLASHYYRFPHCFSYRDILPFDSSRVVLEKAGPSSNDGYINACHVIDLLPGCPRFVCAQGALLSVPAMKLENGHSNQGAVLQINCSSRAAQDA